MLEISIPKLKPEAEEIIKKFIKEAVEDATADGVIVGLSGGIDSTVVTKLCKSAVGKNKVLALLLPENTPSESREINATIKFAKDLEIEWRCIEIGEIVEKFKFLLSDNRERNYVSKVWLGNIKARIRMIFLYYYANSMNRVVMGTGNKSELLTGYFTKYGDGGVDFLPIGDLYKTQVKELALKLAIPKRILERKPSAGLWKGQTDEAELGVPYEILDKILYGIELGYTDDEISQRTNVRKEKIKKVRRMVNNSIHKRKIPSIPKISMRTVGLDWRE